MKLEYRHKVIKKPYEDVVKHSAVLYVKTRLGKTYKFKNVRLLGEDLGTTMYAERRQLQDVLDSVENYLNYGTISKEEMKYIRDHFDDLFFNKVLEFELIKE